MLVSMKLILSAIPINSTNFTKFNKSEFKQLVCVQSVVIDPDNFLWILDAGNPKFSGVIAGAPKLLKVLTA
jgi:hypothetical protein